MTSTVIYIVLVKWLSWAFISYLGDNCAQLKNGGSTCEISMRTEETDAINGQLQRTPKGIAIQLDWLKFYLAEIGHSRTGSLTPSQKKTKEDEWPEAGCSSVRIQISRRRCASLSANLGKKESRDTSWIANFSSPIRKESKTLLNDDSQVLTETGPPRLGIFLILVQSQQGKNNC